MATTQGLRLPDSIEGEYPEGYDRGRICFWRYRSLWMLSLPPGTVGNLSLHDVTEHEDGTITVTPSIKITGRADNVYRHGFLKRGVWEPCSDDRPPTGLLEASHA